MNGRMFGRIYGPLAADLNPHLAVMLDKWGPNGLHGPSCPKGCPVIGKLPKRTLRRRFDRLESLGYIFVWRDARASQR